jgi:hypothetical protein
MVGTLAYYWTRKPPTNNKPRDNVQIQLCSIQTCQIHPLDHPDCARNVGYCADLVAWGKVTDHLYFWHYVANFKSYLIPLPLLRSVASRVRFSLKNGGKGIFMQGPAPCANLGGLRNYVICNLLWDPKRDEHALIDEFLRLHYGDQADAVHEYIAIIHDAAWASGQHPPYLGSAEQFGITPEVARQGLAVLHKAMAATDDKVLRTRLERETVGCYGALTDRVALPLVWRQAPAATAVDKQAARPYIGKFFELARKHNARMYSEHESVAGVEDGLRKVYGLGEGEAW